jgi:hypothetical protein
VVVLEVAEAADDLLDGGVADNIFNRKYINLRERVEVAADCRVPTGADFGVVTEEVTALLVEALV